jgi:hypothetical protein
MKCPKCDGDCAVGYDINSDCLIVQCLARHCDFKDSWIDRRIINKPVENDRRSTKRRDV